ncbi:MAG TPA: glycosyltransferase family 4 protein [Pseudacidobacterium sp.]|jgi:glycosyltransferase involved in cell wall biosynthesis|nr:glycosyltransferase family 4 protein [Pseudacidobacterium sp.]
MKVLIPDNYLMTFNLPEEVRKYTVRSHFYNLGRFWKAAEAVAVHSPAHSCQIVHCMNKIPLTPKTPWVVTFESGLPRTHNRSKALEKLLREQLLTSKCLGMVAMSQWATGIFQLENRDWKKLPQALSKLSVIYPTVPVQRTQPRTLKKDETLEIAFVGNNFARKGGIVALRLAKKAAKLGLKIRIHIVSAMRYAGGEHMDHPDRERYAADMKYMDLPNICFHGALPNNAVQEILERSHLLLLATLHDTFGFSVLEGFSWGLPAMVTNVCALPEMVTAGESGYFLQLPKNNRNGWSGVSAAHSNDYWAVLNEAYESMTNQALESVVNLLDHPDLLEKLSYGAIQTLKSKFNPNDAGRAIENIYRKILPAGASIEHANAWDRVA